MTDTLSVRPELDRIIDDIRDRLDQLENRRDTTGAGGSGALTSTTTDLVFAKQMYGADNDPGGGAPLDPWGEQFGGLFDPGSNSPEANDCAYLSFIWLPHDDPGFQDNTGIYTTWLTDAQGTFGSGDLGWFEMGTKHITAEGDPYPYGSSTFDLDMFCTTPGDDHGVDPGAQGEVFLTGFANDQATQGGMQLRTEVWADLFANGPAFTQMHCLAGRPDGGSPDDNTGAQLRLNYVRNDEQQTAIVLGIFVHTDLPEVDHDGSFIIAHDDDGVDWWFGGIRGPVLVDRVSADRYRVTVASGVIGSELV